MKVLKWFCLLLITFSFSVWAQNACRLTSNEQGNFQIISGQNAVDESNYESLSAAMEMFESYVSAGVCSYPIRASQKCSIIPHGESSFILKREDTFKSHSFGKYEDAKVLLSNLAQKNICNIYVGSEGLKIFPQESAGKCQLKFKPLLKRYAIYQGKTKVSEKSNKLNDTLEALIQLNEGGTCEVFASNEVCDINYNKVTFNYKVIKDGKGFSGNLETIADTEEVLSLLVDFGICKMPDTPSDCEITKLKKKGAPLWQIQRGGKPLSMSFEQHHVIEDYYDRLIEMGVCQASN